VQALGAAASRPTETREVAANSDLAEIKAEHEQIHSAGFQKP
jgi:hypothetical protein